MPYTLPFADWRGFRGAVGATVDGSHFRVDAAPGAPYRHHAAGGARHGESYLLDLGRARKQVDARSAAGADQGVKIRSGASSECSCDRPVAGTSELWPREACRLAVQCRLVGGSADGRSLDARLRLHRLHAWPARHWSRRPPTLGLSTRLHCVRRSLLLPLPHNECNALIVEGASRRPLREARRWHWPRLSRRTTIEVRPSFAARTQAWLRAHDRRTSSVPLRLTAPAFVGP